MSVQDIESTPNPPSSSLAKADSQPRLVSLEELPRWLTYLGILALAGGIFVSVGVCAGYHIFLTGAALLTWRQFRWRELPCSAKWLLGFVAAGLVSATINAAAMESSLRPLLKMKYPLFGVVAIFLLRSVFKSFATPARTRAAMNLFLVSVTVASLYGLLKAWGKFDLLTFAQGDFRGRNEGLTGVMRYSHGLQMVLVIFSSLLVYRRYVPQFYHRGLFSLLSQRGLWGCGRLAHAVPMSDSSAPCPSFFFSGPSGNSATQESHAGR